MNDSEVINLQSSIMIWAVFYVIYALYNFGTELYNTNIYYYNSINSSVPEIASGFTLKKVTHSSVPHCKSSVPKIDILI